MSDNLTPTILGRLQKELDSFITKSREEIKNQGAAQIETIKAIDSLQGQLIGLEQRMLSGAVPMSRKSGGELLVAELTKAENLDSLNRAGRCRFEVKGLLPGLETKSSILSSGLFAAEAARGVEAGGRWPYELRRAIPSLETTSGSVFVLKETGYTNNASPQSEGDPKTESTFTFSGVTKPVITVAHYVNFSKQAMDDVPGLGAFLTNSLVWGLEARIEDGILYGDGVTDLDGLSTNQTALSSSLLTASAGWEYYDVFSAAQAQLRADGYVGTHLVLHPSDWHRVCTTKTSTGEYIVGSPVVIAGLMLWGLKVILSPQILEGTFVLFDASRVLMRERQAVTVDISAEHGTNFTSNMLTARCEWRGCQVLSQTAAVIGGSLSTSPA